MPHRSYSYSSPWPCRYSESYTSRWFGRTMDRRAEEGSAAAGDGAGLTLESRRERRTCTKMTCDGRRSAHQEHTHSSMDRRRRQAEWWSWAACSRGCLCRVPHLLLRAHGRGHDLSAARGRGHGHLRNFVPANATWGHTQGKSRGRCLSPRCRCHCSSGVRTSGQRARAPRKPASSTGLRPQAAQRPTGQS